MKILYVENHAIFAENVKNQFLAKHSVTIVPSVAAAKAAIAAHQFDLFLIDYDLDDGKGDEFARFVRASNKQAPIVGVSSHDSGNAALTNAGANAICEKMKFEQIEKVIEGCRPGMD